MKSFLYMISGLLSGQQKAIIKDWKYSIYRLIFSKKKINTTLDYRRIFEKGCDTFFGYYDISPFNNNGQLIYLKKRKNKQDVDICVNQLSDLSDEKVIATSSAWNWQQGCRLRWFPGRNNEIIFNILDNFNYASIVVDTNGKELRKYSYPLYDINSEGKIGLSLNFDRLGYLRPGYGYTCRKYTEGNLTDEAISIVDLYSDSIITKVTYKQICDCIDKKCDFRNCYINHLSFSPNSDKFLFFWIEIINGYHQASLIVYYFDDNKMKPLELKHKVSHYAWLDNDNILCTVYESPTLCKYFTYNTKTLEKKPYCFNALNSDGHPSKWSNSCILTDTYPLKNGYQYLYKVDASKGSKEVLMEIFSKPVANGEFRTDLHPRLSEDKSFICFDSNNSGERELFIIKLDENNE